MANQPLVYMRGSGLPLVELTSETFDEMQSRLSKPSIFCPPTLENVKNKLNYHWGRLTGKISGHQADFVDYVTNISFHNFISPFFNHEFDEVTQDAAEQLSKRFEYKGIPQIGFRNNGDIYTDFDDLFEGINITAEELRKNEIDVGNTIVTRRRLDIAERYVLNKLEKDIYSPTLLGLGFCFTKIVPTFYLYKSNNEQRFEAMTKHIDYLIETPEPLLPKRA